MGRSSETSARPDGTPLILGRPVDTLPSSRFRLGDTPPKSAFAGASALVHCAYDFTARDRARVEEVNVAGSVRLLESAAEAGVPRIVFVSSVSAFDGCQSVYGQGKLAVEQVARRLGAVVVRPGLVWGNPRRGILASASRLPIVPVFDRGRQPMYLAHIDDLAAALVALLRANLPPDLGVVIAAHPSPILFRDVLAGAASQDGRRAPRQFSIPGWAGLVALAALEAAGLRLRFRRDNLLALLNPDPSPSFAPLARLGLAFRPFVGTTVGRPLR